MLPFSGCLLSWKSFIIHVTFLWVLIELEVFYYPCYLSLDAYYVGKSFIIHVTFSGCCVSWKVVPHPRYFLRALSELESRILPMLPFSGVKSIRKHFFFLADQIGEL